MMVQRPRLTCLMRLTCLTCLKLRRKLRRDPKRPKDTITMNASGKRGDGLGDGLAAWNCMNCKI